MRLQLLCNVFSSIAFSACNSKYAGAIKFPEGGYAYLKNINSSDSDYYFLPIRKLIPLEDSMVFDKTKYFFRSFGEPNLSIAPVNENIFRLSVEGFIPRSAIITITKSGMIVKQTKKENKGSLYPGENTNQLTTVESQHYFFLNKFYPFEKKLNRGWRHYVDSMIALYPRLSDAAYYRYLIRKCIAHHEEPFEYDSKNISITESQFSSLVELINRSGFWTLPYRNPSREATTYGWGFCLEANTREKYNVVICSACGNGSDTKRLKQACQKILTYAGISADDFTIWGENQNG